MSFKLRPYQETAVKDAYKILTDHGFVLMALEVRLGKTHCALYLAEKLKARSILFVTTKKTINSGTILDDYTTQQNSFELEMSTYESLHKVDRDHYDVLILDECHLLGAFPKPSSRAKRARDLKAKCKHTILLSGTPTPESYCQLFHVLQGLHSSPWSAYNTFYKWSRTYVNVTQKRVSGGRMANDYSDGKPIIFEDVKPYMVSCSQEEAEFKSEVQERFVDIPVDPRLHRLIDHLKTHKVYTLKSGGNILADTAVKEQSKVHQLCSGTVKTEEGDYVVLDRTKAEYIKDTWKGRKIAVFYQFKAELMALQEVLGHIITTDIQEFYDTDRSIALQFVSGRSGISLKQAECLVMYNVAFSATTYFQARDRLTTQDREDNRIYWLFSDTGFERYVYQVLRDKDRFTLQYFLDWKNSS